MKPFAFEQDPPSDDETPADPCQETGPLPPIDSGAFCTGEIQLSTGGRGVLVFHGEGIRKYLEAKGPWDIGTSHSPLSFRTHILLTCCADGINLSNGRRFFLSNWQNLMGFSEAHFDGARLPNGSIVLWVRRLIPLDQNRIEKLKENMTRPETIDARAMALFPELGPITR